MTESSDRELVPPTVGPRTAPFVVASAVSLATAAGIGGLQLTGQANRVPAVLGTVGSWVSAGGIMGILALLIWLQLGNRRLKIDERVVQNAEESDLRDHYAGELGTLRTRLDEAAARNANTIVEIEGKYRRLLIDTEEHYSRLLAAAEKAHEDCKRDRDALRAELNTMKREIEGLRTQIIGQAADRVLALGKPGATKPSKVVMGAARRVRRRLDRGADKTKKS